MDKRGFSLTQLLHDLSSSDRRIKRWQDAEQLVVELCHKQDPQAKRNVEKDPDVLLSVGIGIEAKSTTSMTRDINLNSAAPDPNTYYVVVYHRDHKIRNVAIVSGQSFFCPEIVEIQKTNTRLRPLSNKNLSYRTRIMWQMKSPFEIWGRGNFIVDKLGAVKRY
jgi:hypothetical protein